jgi:hypothetical protein
MDLKGFLKSGSLAREPENFKELDATALYCPKCKAAVPVQKRLLLVLPEGDKYEYRCAFCAESVGTKMDRHDERVV